MLTTKGSQDEEIQLGQTSCQTNKTAFVVLNAQLPHQNTEALQSEADSAKPHGDGFQVLAEGLVRRRV